ncbi:MAG: hypothetical protein ABH851_03385 [Methanobacteriota archaeon]
MNNKIILLYFLLVLMTVNASKVIAIDGDATTRIYPLIPIALALTLLYLATYCLAKEQVIQYESYIRLWNIILLLTFLASAILGLILVIRLNYNWNPNLPFNMLYWHVEAGIALAVISIFHISRHRRYFYLLFRK